MATRGVRTGVIDHSVHTAYSAPGPYAALLVEVEPVPNVIASAVCSVVEHYRVSEFQLPPDTLCDIHARWVRAILDIDQHRHPGAALLGARDPLTRVQGCCRDHTLLSVAIMRQHGVPSRSRLGFSDYLTPGWHQDHVIPEYWTGDRWRRFDPEFSSPIGMLADPTDIPQDQSFHTASRVWLGHRRGTLDVSTYGADPTIPYLHGATYVHDCVIREVAFRFGHELLLWDV